VIAAALSQWNLGCSLAFWPYNYAGDYVLDDSYRGYTIRVTRAARWHAILLEPGTGAVLPTKVTATLREGRGIAMERAQKLVDIYAAAFEQLRDRAA
jgi:hypothetical protein